MSEFLPSPLPLWAIFIVSVAQGIVGTLVFLDCAKRIPPQRAQSTTSLELSQCAEDGDLCVSSGKEMLLGPARGENRLRIGDLRFQGQRHTITYEYLLEIAQDSTIRILSVKQLPFLSASQQREKTE